MTVLHEVDTAYYLVHAMGDDAGGADQVSYLGMMQSTHVNEVSSAR
jgi:hypothetical protein